MCGLPRPSSETVLREHGDLQCALSELSGYRPPTDKESCRLENGSACDDRCLGEQVSNPLAGRSEKSPRKSRTRARLPPQSSVLARSLDDLQVRPYRNPPVKPRGWVPGRLAPPPANGRRPRGRWPVQATLRRADRGALDAIPRSKWRRGALRIVPSGWLGLPIMRTR